jgi:CheY-like chemotaxis protein
MDMQMPVMDGCTAARLIRETLSAEQFPIVAMTANAMREDRDRCLAAGMNAVVTKPINPEDLWKALLRWVKVREGMGAPQLLGKPSMSLSDTSPSVEEAPLMLGLRSIAGLDVDLGLARTTNNPDFYAAMLRRFVSTQDDAVQKIQQAMETKDIVPAERIAHTLKAVAGNLGATLLPARADQLEWALRNGAPEQEVVHAIDQTLEALEQLMQALKDTPGLLQPLGVAEATNLSDVDKQLAWDALNAIQALLANDDSEAAALWETHAPQLRALVPNAAAIEAAIAGFDYEEALQLLRAIEKRPA